MGDPAYLVHPVKKVCYNLSVIKNLTLITLYLLTSTPKLKILLDNGQITYQYLNPWSAGNSGIPGKSTPGRIGEPGDIGRDAMRGEPGNAGLPGRPGLRGELELLLYLYQRVCMLE